MSDDLTDTVLVVDDDPDVRDLLIDYLSGQGYRVLAAAGAAEARGILGRECPAAVLLDVGLPGEDGLSLARHIRERYDIGILMISGAGETLDRIVGLEVGADDYVPKPFEPRELKARLKGLLRRYGRSEPQVESAGPPDPVRPAGPRWPPEPQPSRRVQAGACTLDLDSRQLFGPDGSELPITRLELELLEVFIQRPNRPLSRDQILNLTQNRDWSPFDRSVDIRIARLRRKIEPGSGGPSCIRTVRGIGYMYVPPRPAATGPTGSGTP